MRTVLASSVIRGAHCCMTCVIVKNHIPQVILVYARIKGTPHLATVKLCSPAYVQSFEPPPHLTTVNHLYGIYLALFDCFRLGELLICLRFCARVKLRHQVGRPLKQYPSTILLVAWVAKRRPPLLWLESVNVLSHTSTRGLSFVLYVSLYSATAGQR